MTRHSRKRGGGYIYIFLYMIAHSTLAYAHRPSNQIDDLNQVDDSIRRLNSIRRFTLRRIPTPTQLNRRIEMSRRIEKTIVERNRRNKRGRTCRQTTK